MRGTASGDSEKVIFSTYGLSIAAVIFFPSSDPEQPAFPLYGEFLASIWPGIQHTLKGARA
jgi:hypothetical protein